MAAHIKETWDAEGTKTFLGLHVKKLPEPLRRHWPPRWRRQLQLHHNGHGDAEPGSLAYYGGGRWHKIRRAAQDTLNPYRFGPATSD